MIKGIDLSEHNTNVDYKGLKESGIEFAILRVGYGKNDNQRDKMFDVHYRGCKDVGIKVGAYHYSYCEKTENAIKEAENCLNFLNGIELDLPVFYDLEDRVILNAGINVTEIGLIFTRKIRERGYNSGVYANLNWFKNYINPYTLINEGNKIWLAQWNVKKDSEFNVDIWQYTDNMFNTNNNRIDGNYLINEELLKNEDKKSYKEMAVDVIYGKYGNGEERKQKLGTSYNEVQKIVNDLYKIIKE